MNCKNISRESIHTHTNANDLSGRSAVFEHANQGPREFFSTLNICICEQFRKFRSCDFTERDWSQALTTKAMVRAKCSDPRAVRSIERSVGWSDPYLVDKC